MTDERRKEIALQLAELKVLDEGLPGGTKLKQDLGNVAKKLEGVSTEELMRFYQTFVPKLYGRIFEYDSVEIKAQASPHLRD